MDFSWLSTNNLKFSLSSPSSSRRPKSNFLGLKITLFLVPNDFFNEYGVGTNCEQFMAHHFFKTSPKTAFSKKKRFTRKKLFLSVLETKLYKKRLIFTANSCL